MTASADPERPASSEKATKGSVPKPLASAGEYGENVYDAAKTGDWKTADQKVASLKDSASRLTAGSSQERSALRSEITSLEKAVSQRYARAAQLESNQVTLTVAEMSAGYSNPVQTRI
jgi:ATP-dependent DNA ligase